MASLLEAPILEAVRDLQRRMTTLEQGAYVSAPTGHTVSTDAETQKISMQTQKISMQTAVHSFKDDAVATRIESNEAATPFVTEAARATRTVCRRARRRRLEQSNRRLPVAKVGFETGGVLLGRIGLSYIAERCCLEITS